MFWDTIFNFFFLMAVNYTQPADRLSAKKPEYRLMTCSNITKIFTMYIMQLIVQILMMYFLSTVFAEEVDYIHTATPTTRTHIEPHLRPSAEIGT